MAELRMLSAGPADMREVGLDARAHSGSPAAEACRRESHAPVVSGRIERCDRHVACALRRGQQAIVPGIHEIRERCGGVRGPFRSEEHTSELQSLMRISYAVFCLKKKTKDQKQ